MKGWECMYIHKEQGLILSVYVDDFKVVAQASEHKQIWKEVRGVINMEDGKVGERFLGCRCANCSASAAVVHDIFKQHLSYRKRAHPTKEDCSGDLRELMIDPKRTAKGTTCDMEDVVEQCMD